MCGADVAQVHMLVQLERWSDAEAAALRLPSTEADNVEALCLLARARLGADRDIESLQAADQAVRLAPDNEWALRLIAHALSNLDRHREAIAAAHAAVSAAPQMAESYLTLARVLIVADQAKEAIAVAQRGVRLDPHAATGFTILATAYAGAGNRRRSKAALEQALELDPANTRALDMLARVDARTWRLGGSIRNVVAALQTAPTDAGLRARLDLLGEMLAIRLLNAMLLTGFVLVVVLVAETSSPDPSPVPRMLVGVLLVTLYVGVVWVTARQLPPGYRRYLRSLPLRSAARWRWVLLGVVSLTMLVTAFAPRDAAGVGAGLFAAVIQVLQIVAVVMVVRWLWRKISGIR
jgi:tetratricopeptide (TPR) repeat protein